MKNHGASNNGIANKSYLVVSSTFLFLGLLFSTTVNAATITTTGSGNWSSTVPNAPWPGGVIPSAGDDVVIGNGNTLTVDGNRTINTISFSAPTNGAGSGTLQVGAGFTLTVTGKIAAPASATSIKVNGTYNISGAGSITTSAFDCNNATAPSGNATTTIVVNSSINSLSIAGNLTLNSTVANAKLNNATFNLTSGSLSVGGSIVTTSSTNLNVSTFDMVTKASSPSLTLAGSTPFAITTIGTTNLLFNGVGATVNYSHPGDQSVRAASYTNLTVSGSGVKTATGVSVSGILSMQGTASVSAAPTYGTSATLEYKGSALQITGAEFPVTQVPPIVSINNTNGVSLNANRTVSATLNFVNGRIITGANKLTLSATGVINGAGAGKYVQGNLEMQVPNATSVTRTFPIGGAVNYAPVTVVFNGTTTGSGSITASTSDGDHSDIDASGLNASSSVNRTWTLVNNNVAGFTSFAATFNFVSNDVDAGATPATFAARRLTSATWNTTTVSSAGSNATQVTGLTAFGTFQLGNTNSLTISAAPESKQVCNGNATTFSISNSAVPTPTIVWQRDANTGTFVNISAATDGGVYNDFTTAVLSIGNVTGLNNYKYRAVLTNINGTATSSAATLTVTPVPAATISYAGTPYCSNSGLAQVNFSGTTGGTYSSSTGLSINSATGTINLAASTPGSYVVSYTINASGGCSSFVTTTNIDINPAPFATISYGATQFCLNGGTAAATITGTTGGVFSSTSGLVINAVNGQIDLNSSDVGNYVITYSITVPGCSTYQTTTSVSIASSGTWTGMASNDWSNNANWYCNNLPTNTTDVTIPAAVPNYPMLISGTGAARNITVASGASVEVAGGQLTIAGTITNNGIINAVAGSVALAGITAQTIAANTFENNTIKDLIIENQAGVILAGALNIKGFVSLERGNLSTNGYLTLKSDSIQTASIAAIPTDAAGAALYEIIGDVNIETFIPGGKRVYRFYGHPFTTGKALTTLLDDIDITGTAGASAGFTVTQLNNPSSFWYNNNSGWAAFTHTNGTGVNEWKRHQGIRLMIRGQKGQGLNTTNYVPFSTTLDMTGSVNTGRQVVSLTKGSFDGYNLVSNPFPSPVNMAAPTAGATNLTGSTYTVWNANFGSQGGYEAVLVGENFILPANAAIFVSVTANTNITFNETDKEPVTEVRLFKSASTTASGMKLKLFRNGRQYDKMYLINKISPATFTTADGKKLMNPEADLYSVSADSVALSADARAFTAATVIPLGIKTTITGTYSITFEDMNIPDSLTAYLKDNYTGTQEVLYEGKEYSLVLNQTTGTQGLNRLSIVFSANSTLDINSIQLSAARDKEKIRLEWQDAAASKAKVYEIERADISGNFTKIGSVEPKAIAVQTFMDAGVIESDVYYRVKQVCVSGAIFYSNVARIRKATAEPSISVYPNPVVDRKASISYNNVTAGNYSLKIVSIDGRTVVTSALLLSASSGTIQFNINPAIAPGRYSLVLSNETASYTIGLLIQ